jgi:RimJ/RimL family protein N-acetyltransferase
MLLMMPKESDRCRIRPYEQADIPSIAEVEFDPVIKKYVGIPNGTKESWISRASLDLLHGWAVVALPENEFAGRVCLGRAKDRSVGVVELEIIISSKYWGRGMGRAVASLMIPAAFNEMNAMAVLAEVHPENKASLALLTSFGFRYKCLAENQPILLYELDREAFNAL